MQGMCCHPMHIALHIGVVSPFPFMALIVCAGRWKLNDARRESCSRSSTRTESSTSDGKFDKEGKRCAASQLRTQRSPFTTNPTGRPALGRVSSTDVSPPLAAPESSQEIGPSHPALSESSKTARLPPSLTERWVDRSKGGVVAHASPCWLLALGAVCSVERKEDRFNT